MSFFSDWKERRKHKDRDKWLIREFPRLALALFQALRDSDPFATKEQVYTTMIKGFGHTFGVPNEKQEEFTEHILATARLCEPSEPFGLRMIVVALICSTWSLKSELSIAVAINSVSEVIPDYL